MTRTSFQLTVRVPNDIVARINRYGEHLRESTGVELSQAQVVLALLCHALDDVEKRHVPRDMGFGGVTTSGLTSA